MENSKVRALVDEALEENKSLFLIDLFISAENKIKVTVDGDNGVPLSECIRISRNVEHNLDREEDFSLEVTTPDISQPLSEKRQYVKNIGRILKVKTTNDEKFEGTLSSANENEIELQWKTREPKPIGKGKVTVEKTATIEYKDIKEAKVKILF